MFCFNKVIVIQSVTKELYNPHCLHLLHPCINYFSPYVMYTPNLDTYVMYTPNLDTYVSGPHK